MNIDWTAVLIIDSITILPSNKSIGQDDISHKMLKSIMFMYLISILLCLLCNKSLNDCMFPCSWKIRLLFPYLRKTSELINYIPVYLLKVGKIMERILSYVYAHFFFMTTIFFLQVSGRFITGPFDSIPTYRNLRLYFKSHWWG